MPTMVPINKIRFNTTRSCGVEGPQIGIDPRNVILRSDEIRLQYFDSRLRDYDAAVAAATRALETSARQRCGESGDQLDQVGLTADAGLFKQAAEMGLDGGGGDAERRSYFGNAADVDDGMQHAQLGRR